MRDALGVPDRRVQKLIRFDRDEVMAWAKRWSQEAKDQGIESKADPAYRHRWLRRVQALVGGVEVDLDAPLSADDE